MSVVLFVFGHRDELLTKHVVAHGWNAVSVVDLIREKWKGIWDETGENFYPWHSIYKITQEEVADESSKESSVHGSGQAPELPTEHRAGQGGEGTARSSVPESEVSPVGIEGAGLAHP